MISSDIQKLNPGQIVDLFELDAASLGGSKLLWHNGVNSLSNDVVWQGQTYSRFPVEASGFERSGSGAAPRPMLRVANVTGLMGAMARELGDLCGATVVRRRTFSKYLDAVNFPGGVNPQADPNVGFPKEVWTVDRKSAENGVYVEFELASAFDVQGVFLPRRQCIQNTCTWAYRSAECGYAGGPVADKFDVTTAIVSLDQCGKRLSSCKIRFGVAGILPYGGFPGAGMR